jgi:mono/diheme cytochrome c family protein
MAFDQLTFALMKLAGIAGAGLALLLTGCDRGGADLTAAGEPAPPARVVARGEYLVSTLGCHDCHTPWTLGKDGPAPDMSRMLSGHPESLTVTEKPSLEGPWVWAGTGTNTGFYGPWGVSYAANLTPDVSGLQIWTEDMFIRAIRTGKHMGQSRPIAPPMPWPVYRNLTDEDLAAVYAYLRTIPPVRNNVPEYEPAVAAR